MANKAIDKDYLLKQLKNFAKIILDKRYSKNSVELNMLGWNVPKECTVQNEVDGVQFIQNIDRVKLSQSDCKYVTSVGLFKITVPVKSRGALFSSSYTPTIKAYNTLEDKEMTAFYDSLTTDVCVLIKDSRYTDIDSFKASINEYLYYELATPVEKVIDGNEILTEVNEKIDNIYANGYASTNLLPYPYVGENALSGSKVEGGLTYTDNGDGSITIDGTSTGTSYVRLNVNGGIFGDISGAMISDKGQLEIGEYTAIISETKDNRLIVAYDPSRDLLAITANGSGQVFNNEKFYPRVVKNNVADKSYNAYSKSNVDLTTEISRKELELAELKMLGWNVPKECPVQNTVSGNTFTQKVGRVDLGTLEWEYRSSDGLMLCQTQINSKTIAETATPNIYCNAYKALPRSGSVSVANTDKSIALPNKYIIVRDSGFAVGSLFKASVKGVYLYYELENPITIQIDGNEILDNFGTLCNYTEGFYFNEQKKYVADENYVITDYISINDTDAYTLVCKHIQDNSCLLCYDAGKNPIGVYSAFDRTITKFVDGTRYVRISFKKANLEQSTIRDKNGNDLYKACKFNLEEFEKVKSAQIPTTTHTISYTTTSGTTKSITVYGK